MELDIKNCESPPSISFVKVQPKLELKDIPLYLRYIILGKQESLPVIIASYVKRQQVEGLVSVLKRFERAIACTTVDIIKIPPNIYSHKIQLMSDHKLSIEP